MLYISIKIVYINSLINDKFYNLPNYINTIKIPN